MAADEQVPDVDDVTRRMRQQATDEPASPTTSRGELIQMSTTSLLALGGLLAVAITTILANATLSSLAESAMSKLS
jgi:hypothetical protein